MAYVILYYHTCRLRQKGFGYNSVENVTLVCCLAHCRRYFFEAVPAVRRRKIKLLDDSSPEEIPQEAADPERAKEDGRLPAGTGLCYCSQLFRIERTLKGLDAQGRKAKRLELEVPVWERFWDLNTSIKKMQSP